MSFIGMAIASVGATVGAWVLHRRRVETWRSPEPRKTLTKRQTVVGSTNPRDLAAHGVRLWQLNDGGGQCEIGRTLRGRRLRAEDTVPLPAAGCRVDCRCIYQPVREARRDERRIGSDRRDTLRFQGSERRRSERRVRRNGWGEGVQS